MQWISILTKISKESKVFQCMNGLNKVYIWTHLGMWHTCSLDRYIGLTPSKGWGQNGELVNGICVNYSPGLIADPCHPCWCRCSFRLLHGLGGRNWSNYGWLWMIGSARYDGNVILLEMNLVLGGVLFISPTMFKITLSIFSRKFIQNICFLSPLYKFHISELSIIYKF